MGAGVGFTPCYAMPWDTGTHSADHCGIPKNQRMCELGAEPTCPAQCPHKQAAAARLREPAVP